ncbi:MAG: hypothetical protein F6K54_34375 [Okeania sp. SIO3B5]|nr:hypothetical protein [Okeania sp. SIO3B5]NEO57707.1 hypothetical protein [Okeania sp. SIO3B5]
MGRWGDGEMGRWGDGEMGRWGDGEMGSKQISTFLPYSILANPCSL